MDNPWRLSILRGRDCLLIEAARCLVEVRDAPQEETGMPRERRAHPRVRGRVECTWSGSPRHCRGLSVSGCFVESLVLPDVGSTVRVELHLPYQGSVSVMGEVVRTDEVSMGFSVRFVDLTPETRDMLARAADGL